MAKTFQFKKGDIRDWKQFHRDFAKAQKFAQIGHLNKLAFRTRGAIIDELGRNMTIRFPGFVKGSVKFEKASLKRPMSEVGSVKRERFSGWIEQETGQKTQRKRVQTLAARNRNWKRRVAPRFRLKPSAKFIRPVDVKLNRTQIVPFLQILDARRYKQPFYIPIRYKRMQRGIYVFIRRKIRRVQTFDPKNVQPKRDEWMSRAVGQLTPQIVNDEYKAAMEFSIRKSSRLQRYRR
jgi:hypothetical protein